jgi:hypothetical protein
MTILDMFDFMQWVDSTDVLPETLVEQPQTIVPVGNEDVHNYHITLTVPGALYTILPRSTYHYHSPKHGLVCIVRHPDRITVGRAQPLLSM